MITVEERRAANRAANRARQGLPPIEGTAGTAFSAMMDERDADFAQLKAMTAAAQPAAIEALALAREAADQEAAREAAEGPMSGIEVHRRGRQQRIELAKLAQQVTASAFNQVVMIAHDPLAPHGNRLVAVGMINEMAHGKERHILSPMACDIASMPPGDAMTAIIAATASGEISAEDAMTLTRLIEGKLGTIDAQALIDRMAQLEKILEGVPRQ